MKRLILSALLLSMMVLACIPLSHSTLSGSSFVAEITSLPFNPKVVDVDSSGRIFVGDQDNDVWRSIDNGATWTKMIDGSATGGVDIGFVYVNSLDYVFTTVWQSGTNHSVYRSIDHGASWSVVQASSYAAWNIGEMSNGTMFYNTMTTWKIYKSNDAQGSSWSQFYDGTSLGVEHFHWVYVSDNDDIYLTTGDGQYDATVMRWNAGSWDTIANDTKALLYYQTVAMTSDSTYMYFFGDGASRDYRMLHAGTSSADFEWIMDTTQYQASATNFAYDAVRIGEVYLFGTDDGEVWGSWDGLHWVKVFDSGTAGWIYRFSRQSPIYFVDAGTNKLYRLDIQKEDLVQLYYQTYNSLHGYVSNAASYVLEQRLSNGSNHVDLTSVALSDVQASIKGLSRTNEALAPAYVGNAGFEFGNTTGWTVNSGAGSFGVATVTNTDKANGTYSLKYVKGAGDSTDALFYEPYATAYTTINRGDVWVVSAYVKANVSSADRVRIIVANASAAFQSLTQDTFDVTTSWTRIKFYYMPKRTTPTLPINICASFRVLKGIDITVYWDSILIQKLEAGIAYNNGQTNNEIHKWETPFSYFTTTQTTTNPSLTISGQAVSYVGTLTNGTESTATSLTGTLTGAITVNAVIAGSGQAILKLNGTRTFYEDSVITQARTNGVIYGRYYSTFTPTITSTDLVAVTNLTANITSISYAGNILTLTVNSPSATTSTTKIHCTNSPTDVQGETSWNYDAATSILTVTATHASSVTLIVDWGDVGIGEIAYGGGTDLLLLYLLDGDLFGFFIGCYTSKVGMVFYGILILIVSGVFYNRTKSVVFLGIIWLLLGGTFIAVTWIFSPIAVILCALGFTGLIYGLYDKESS